MAKQTILIVIGGESTATRITTKYLASHPDIYWNNDPEAHHPTDDEIIERTWKICEFEGTTRFKVQTDKPFIITRRSVPHGGYYGDKAQYMHMMNVDRFISSCKRSGYDVIMLITTRSPLPHISSWGQKRGSVRPSTIKAHDQYQETYKHLFKSVIKYDIIYYILSLEAMVQEKENFINSIYTLIGLSNIELNLEFVGSNDSYYKKRFRWI